MRKICFFALFLFSGFFAFAFDVGEISTIVSARVYTWNDSFNSSNVVAYTMVKTPSDVVQLYLSVPFALQFNNSSFGSISSPTLLDGYTTGNTQHSIDYQVRLTTTNSLTANFSPLVFPEIRSFATLANLLLRSGYRGKGLVLSPDSRRANVYYPDLVGELSVSTNNTWRSLVLSYLFQINNNISTISSSFQNIDLNVSGLQSSIVDGNNMLSNVDRSVSSLVDVGFSNLVSSLRSADSLLSIDTNLVSVLSSVRSLENPFVKDFTNALDSVADIDSSYTPSDVSYLKAAYSSFDSPLTRDLFALSLSRRYEYEVATESFINRLRNLSQGVEQVGNSFNYSVVDALIGDYPIVTNSTRGSKSVGVRSSIKSQLQSWREDAMRQLQDWKNDLKQDFQDWKTSDERGILNVRDDIRNNFSYSDPRSGNTNNLPFTSFVTNYVTHVITNVIRQSSDDISSNIVDQADLTRKLFDDKLFDPNSDGVNVRIKWPLRYESTSEVNVHDQALDDILGNLHSYTITMSNLVEGALLEFKNNLTATNSVDWGPWFEKWGEYADIVTNYYVQFNSSGPVADLADRFLSQGFDSQAYGELPWFSRVEVLLSMIAGVSTNSVDVADISEELDGLVDEFSSLGTNVVSSSESFVGLFDYVRRTADRFKSVFGDRSAPVTDGGIVLLSAGSWIGYEPLVLKVNSTVQNVLRLFFRCFWLLSALVVVWLVVSWSWQKVVAILRWLWSMFEL